MDASADDTDLSALLVRLGAQLHEANRMGQTVEEAIGDLIRHTNRSGLSATASFQQLDFLVQALENLALYVEALAAAVPDGTRVDAREAGRRVKLRALSHALLARDHAEGDLRGTDDPDDLHLF